MGRPKMFRREDVLEKAIPVFWAHGFAATRLQDLEEATGVNKSGLYSEFADKEDLFLASLQHYAATSSGQHFLSPMPLGWTNIEVRNGVDGRPQVLVCGTARETMLERGIADVLVSISHCRTYATAYAMAVGRPSPPPAPAPPG